MAEQIVQAMQILHGISAEHMRGTDALGDAVRYLMGKVEHDVDDFARDKGVALNGSIEVWVEVHARAIGDDGEPQGKANRLDATLGRARVQRDRMPESHRLLK